MSDQNTAPGGYDEFYLRQNPADQANYARKARGYRKRMRPLLDGVSVNSCLDVGCATGLLAYWLRKEVCEDVVGVDQDAALLDIARANVPARFVLDDAGHYLATCGRRFDAVFLLNILEHIPHEQVVGFLTSVRNGVNEGGIAIIRTPNLNCLTGMGHFCEDFTHRTALTENSLEQIARQAGFSRVEMCNQFRTRTFTGKIRACLNWLMHRAVYGLEGGRCPKVFYHNIYARLYR